MKEREPIPKWIDAVVDWGLTLSIVAVFYFLCQVAIYFI